MTARHRDPEYRKNARLIRQITNARLQRGEQVQCVDCGHPVTQGQRYDVGHIHDGWLGGNNTLNNLGPSHVRCNRPRGGRAGAAITNSKSRAARRLPEL